VKYWTACFAFSLCFGQSYQDPQNRFAFDYPPEFGALSPGTNDGFGDRVVAIRFERFSAGVQNGMLVFGGEAVLTRGFPLLDLQAAGGLYDEITLEIFPQPLRAIIMRSLPRLTLNNFCTEIAKATHVDPLAPAFASFSASQRQALQSVDRMGNGAPTVSLCETAGDTIRFHKEAAAVEGGARRHIYGAVRFLAEPYSTFQLIRGGSNPPPAVLDRITALVQSWRAR